jgi:hypothetical protein
MTWPWVTRLRDAVVDPGDPYLISWILWWDYHATFTDPLNLFHANIFYPYKYTLAFSEHSYGIAMLFFWLFALGARPLTVHAVAMFFGFVMCGYGAFRLARTLTHSNGAAWITGIVFAFIPYRFHLMSQVAYLFSPWIPLLFEALVLFARQRTRKHAAWLGVAFFMSGLTTISWFALSLVPLALSAAVLLTRYGSWRDRSFWLWGGVALSAGSIALLPFMLPYLSASRLYGFKRSIESIRENSAWPIHWLAAEDRNQFWRGLGSGIDEAHKFKLFPGLLPVVLALVGFVAGEPAKAETRKTSQTPKLTKWVSIVDGAIIVSLVVTVLVLGYQGTDFYHGLFNYIPSERPIAVLAVLVVARLCLAYPATLQRPGSANLIDTIRSERRSDAFWLGSLWVVIGFCYSLGWNFFFYRILYDVVPIFRSMRVATRGAMIAYLGIALLAGPGVRRLAELIREKRLPVAPSAVYVIFSALLLFELNAAPLKFMRGDVYPNAVTLRLKNTSMRGGIVVLPAGNEYNHHHVLRAADHEKPLIVGISGFNPPYENEIEQLTLSGPIPFAFLDLLEKVPASYLVVENQKLRPEQKLHYEAFLSQAVAVGRLRFINRFDGQDDLYAVVKTEPETTSETEFPFKSNLKEWAKAIKEDPLNLLGHHRRFGQAIHNLYVVAVGRMPRYEEFIQDAQMVGKGVIMGVDEQDSLAEANLERLGEAWTHRARFASAHGGLSDADYVTHLLRNAHLEVDAAERAALVERLENRSETRADVLVRIATDEQVMRREENRALVLMHFFAYLRRNPDDPPDGNLDGFLHWLREIEKHGNLAMLSEAFANSIERRELVERSR